MKLSISYILLHLHNISDCVAIHLWCCKFLRGWPGNKQITFRRELIFICFYNDLSLTTLQKIIKIPTYFYRCSWILSLRLENSPNQNCNWMHIIPRWRLWIQINIFIMWIKPLQLFFLWFNFLILTRHHYNIHIIIYLMLWQYYLSIM